MAKSNRITLTEVARQSGTSPMAVSVVLNGARSNTRVSDATRRRIMEVALDLNYSPNAMAQGLKRQRTNTIGVLFNWAGRSTVHSLFSIAVLDGIVDGAAAAGYHILLYTEGWKNAAQSSSLYSDSRTDGMILVAPDTTSDIIPSFVSLEIPAVLLSSMTDIPGIDYVTLDNFSGISLALDHLLELGHTHIAFIGRGIFRHTMKARYNTYITWMQHHEFVIHDGDVIHDLDESDQEKRVALLSEWLKRPNAATAVVCVTDELASEVLEAARNIGMNVPEQLSVVGFDDVLLASLTQPKLTTIHQPLSEMGQQAAQLLIENIEKRGVSSEKPAGHVVVPKLIVRGSTGPVSQKAP